MEARKQLAGNMGTGTLKIIALIFMFTDHAGKMLFNNMTELRLLGRIAFPIYAWCLVVGMTCTHSVPKYMLRILVTGLISQPLYMIALNHQLTEPNIFLTLLLGAFALWGLRDRKWGSQFWAPALALAAAVLLSADYGWRGVLFIILLYAVRNTRAGIAAVCTSFFLFWGSTSSTLTSLFGVKLSVLTGLPVLQSILPSFLHLQTMALLALPFILIRIPREKDIRMPAWLSYAIYPAHLVLLWGLEKVFL